MCRSTWEAAPHSHWAGSAATAAGRCRPAMCCTWAQRRAALAAHPNPAPSRPMLRPSSAMSGRSACSTDRTARPISSPTTTCRILRATWEVHYNSNRTGVRLIGTQAQMGAQRRRRGGAASLEHPRQRLCHRHGGFHRRHAGHPGPGRTVLGRLRVPGDCGAGRALEAGPTALEQSSSLQAPVGAGGAAGAGVAGTDAGDAAHAGGRGDEPAAQPGLRRSAAARPARRLSYPRRRGGARWPARGGLSARRRQKSLGRIRAAGARP